MATRSLVPETGGLRVGATRWAGGGLVIEVELHEPPRRPRFMACGSSLEDCRMIWPLTGTGW